MPAWVHSRYERVRRFARVVVAIVGAGVLLGSVILLAFERYGWSAVGIILGFGGAAFLVVVVVSDATWNRLTTDPRVLAREAAIQDVSDRILESDAIRRHLFTDLPDANAMRAEVSEWISAAATTIRKVAPAYVVDFETSASPELKQYRAANGKELTDDQAGVIGRFDMMRGRLTAILKELRRS